MTTNRFTPGCCCGCKFLDIPMTRDVVNPQRVISFNSLRVESEVTTGTTIRILTYENGENTGSNVTFSEDTEVFEETTETITGDLSFPTLVTGELERLPNQSERVWDPPEAENGDVQDYTTTITSTSVRIRYTRSVRRRIAVEFGTEQITDFGRIRADGVTPGHPAI